MVSGYKLYEMRLPDPARYAFIRTSVVTSHKSNPCSSAFASVPCLRSVCWFTLCTTVNLKDAHIKKEWLP